MARRPDEARLAEELAQITGRLIAGEPAGRVEDEMRGLVEMVAKLRAAVAGVPLSPDFAARLRERALAELPVPQASISERLQEVIARLLGEEEFRQGFFASPEAALRRAGIQLSAAEMAALKAMEPEDLKEWMADLDERISKSGLTGG
jgi:hypothetical protein